MSTSCLAELLARFVTLTATEEAALATLETRERVLRRGAILQRAQDPVSELYVLRRGSMMSYVLLDDGSRQVLRFLFPGDMVASTNLAYREAAETLSAVTECVVAGFERQALANLVDAHPRLGLVILAASQVERVMLTDRLAALGRSPARTRVAALLLELREKLQRNAAERNFVLIWTQEELGDAIGLTSVHVNRMLRQLEEEGLIAREGAHVTFLDEAGLRHAAGHVDRYATADLTWLPGPR